MTAFLLGAAFIVGIAALPWWAWTFFAILFLAAGGNPLLVLAGGIVADLAFGAPIASLHGFSFLHTALATVLSVTTLYLRRALYE